MISLKKHIDDWNSLPLDNPELGAYRSLLVTAGKASHLAVPDLGDNLDRRLSELAASLSFETPPERIENANQIAQAEIGHWVDQAVQRREASERDHREIIDVMVKAVESVTERDERYAREVGNLAERLRAIAGVNDMAAIRRSIIEGVNALTACVERISQDGRMSLLRLSEQVEDYRSRLDKSERLSALDVVTGISNRRVFEERLSTKVRASSRFCLILIDLDGFKRVNDRFGHLAGDEVLKHVAAKLRLQFPSADMVARWGGDEFAVIITSRKSDVEARINRLRRSGFGECRLDASDPTASVPVEASVGVVEWDGQESGPELLARADHSMYHSKGSTKMVRVSV
jgi:diguanylate cyclase (GGDEF)-like protein